MPGGEPAASLAAAQPAAAVAPTAVPLAVTGEQLAQVAGGLASLDVQLPERGQLYQFTTPRGEISVAANSISVNVLSRLMRLGFVLGLVAIGWVLTRPRSLQEWRKLLESTPVGVALIIVGFASLLGGILPLAGLLTMLSGIAVIVRSRSSRAIPVVFNA